jgi:hypothetical protein
MNAKRLSMTVIAAAVLALSIAPGLAGAQEGSEGNAYYQMIRKELIEVTETEPVVDFETMKFLEDNTLGYHDPMAGFLQLDTAGTILVITSPCQGEGLVSDAAAQSGIAGAVETYCRGEAMADVLGGRTGAPPAGIPLHPDWPDGFGIYPGWAPGIPSVDTPSNNAGVGWPIGFFDY